MDIQGIWVSPAMVPALCEITGAHRTTVARWLKAGRLPPTVAAILRILQRGDLGAVHSDWHGWTINRKDGLLYTPHDQRNGYRPGHVMALPWRLQQLAVTAAENRVSVAANESVPARCRDGAGSV